MKRKSRAAMVALFAVALSAYGEIKPPKPGFNLFSREQDIQLGREAAAQVQQQMPLVRNSELESYIRQIGERLARTQYAGNYPYTFQVVADPSINAFALPGGPVFVHTGLITNAENEAQLAGVIAHEIAHVALRHGTNQASKANLIQLPAMLAGAMAGGGMLGSLAQLGIGLGANSVLLKFSRTAETQADYTGALMMAEAGYNPIEMARFFEKLEAKHGNSSQFFSDHPNPGNRVRATQELIQQLPQRSYRTDSGQFTRIKQLTASLPGPRQLRGTSQQAGVAAPAPDIRPSQRFRYHSSSDFSIGYPDNWEAFGDQSTPGVTLAPRAALMQSSGGGVQIGYGAMISYYFPQGDRIDLQRDTSDLIRQLSQQNPGMRVANQQQVTVDGERGLLTTLNSRSPYQGESEVDVVVTVPRPEGLLYLVFIAPQSEWRDVEPTFQQMLRSLQFR